MLNPLFFFPVSHQVTLYKTTKFNLTGQSDTGTCNQSSCDLKAEDGRHVYHPPKVCIEGLGSWQLGPSRVLSALAALVSDIVFITTLEIRIMESSSGVRTLVPQHLPDQKKRNKEKR